MVMMMDFSFKMNGLKLIIDIALLFQINNIYNLILIRNFTKSRINFIYNLFPWNLEATHYLHKFTKTHKNGKCFDIIPILLKINI